MSDKKPLSEFVPEKTVEEAAPTVILTQVDAYVHERAKSQPKTLEEVQVRVDSRSVANEHRLSLPKEVQAYEDRFAFYWIFKNKRAIDHALDQRGWTLVNQSLFPKLPKYLFNRAGCVERGDNILGFMPRQRAEELRKIPGKKSKDIVDSQFNKHKDNPNFYVPSDAEDKRVIGI